MRPKGTAKELERRRRRAVALLQAGESQAAVAEALGASEASVSRWKKAYQQDGEAGLASKPHPGKPPRLTARQRERLARMLREGPGRNGCDGDSWTLEVVAELIERSFAVRYHPGHVWHLLRSMGWTRGKLHGDTGERTGAKASRTAWRSDQ